ncbi:GntR family transcriptional regulator [Megasphaera sueciensis]|uniref:GntR family transcriptional regulator n=1 Tax=Megasphaera sueciensis TaxID=349094 RepID=UPI003D08A8A9
MDKQLVETLRQQNPFISLNDIVYSILLQEIVNFHIPPGTAINENAIAKKLEISRSPIKFALLRLKKEGYVKKDNKYRVAGFSNKEYQDVKELCFLLESYAAGRAALNVTDQQLEELQKIAQQMHDICHHADKEDPATLHRQIIKLEYAFHMKLVSLADSPLLLDLYDQIKYKLFRYRSYIIYNPPQEYYKIIETDHLLICHILKLHDRELAESMLRRHLNFFNNHFINLFHLEK